jgi:DnaJ family protein C protein 17
MANSNDLMKWTTSDVDFYELLGLTFETCGESELKRAYRKTALKYHPDKLGKDFDPDKYELFNAAFEVLKDDGLKTKYDNYRNAKLQKKRANELFEGKRRQMKEDLEARERGGASTTGAKRPREEDDTLRKLAEEGRKRRAARESMMGASMMAEGTSSPAPRSPQKSPASAPAPAVVADEQDDEIARLERKIQEAREAKAKRKEEKKARKSGTFVPTESPSVGSSSKLEGEDAATPTKRPGIFRGLKADEKSSASPKFSFSPSTPTSNTPRSNNFAATLARLQAAERRRMEDEIRREESGEVAQ